MIKAKWGEQEQLNLKGIINVFLFLSVFKMENSGKEALNGKVG